MRQDRSRTITHSALLFEGILGEKAGRGEARGWLIGENQVRRGVVRGWLIGEDQVRRGVPRGWLIREDQVRRGVARGWLIREDQELLSSILHLLPLICQLLPVWNLWIRILIRSRNVYPDPRIC